MEDRFAGVELGGTSIKVAICVGEGTNIVEKAVFVTTDDPVASLAPVVSWLAERQFKSLGIASFGPLDLNPSSPTYGYITTTPKPGWRNANVLGQFSCFSCPIAWETDVNAPALSMVLDNERYSVKSNCAYVTVGTGVGVGIVCDGKPVHGRMHPEAGHISVQRHPDDEFAGSCPWHGSCLEGMVASRALAARKGIDRTQLESIADDDPMWRIVAHYLAQLCTTITYTTSPEVIAFGGGISSRPVLLPLIQQEFTAVLNGYVGCIGSVEDYIILAKHADAGLVGAFTIAKLAAARGD